MENGIDGPVPLARGSARASSPDNPGGLLVTTQLDFSLTLDPGASPQGLLALHFLDPIFQGAGFDRLVITVLRDAGSLFEQEFFDKDALASFFDGPAVALGDVVSSAGLPIDLSILFLVDSTSSTDGLHVDWLLAVPEPGTGVMVLVGLTLLRSGRRRAIRWRLPPHARGSRARGRERSDSPSRPSTS